MKSEAARLFVYQDNVSLFWSAVFLIRTSLSSTTLIFDYREY